MDRAVQIVHEYQQQDAHERVTQASLADLSLDQVPPGLERLELLDRLNLSGNALRDVPDEIGRFAHLRYINLRSNALGAFPAALFQLATLKILDVSRNQIAHWPATLGGLMGLQILSVARNRLTELPTYLCDMPNLAVFKCDGNPLVFPPPDLALRVVADDEQPQWIAALRECLRRPRLSGAAEAPVTPGVHSPASLSGSLASGSATPAGASVRTLDLAKLATANAAASPTPSGSTSAAGARPPGKLVMDCASICDALLRRPLPATLAEIAPGGSDQPLSASERAFLQVLRSTMLVLAHSHRFVKDLSKSTVALYKSLRGLLDSVNARLVELVGLLFPSPPPVALADNADSSGGLFALAVRANPPSTILQIAQVSLAAVVHDIRKLLLTLHHNVEKHVVESADPVLLRLTVNEWQAILVELALAVVSLQNWRTVHAGS